MINRSRHNPVFFLLLAGCISLLAGCSKNTCIQHEVGRLTFTAGDQAICPYTGKDTLTFKNLTGDSVIFKKSLMQSGFNRAYQYSASEALDFNGCQGDYLSSEYRARNYICGNIKGKLDVILKNNATFYHRESVKNIQLSFFPGDSTGLGFYASMKFSGDTLMNFPDKFDSIIAFHDSVSLGTRKFYQVYELFIHNEAPPLDDWGEFAYYSLIDGIVGFRSNLGKTWYLYRRK